MEHIKNTIPTPETIERTVILEKKKKKMMLKNILNNAGIIVGVLLMFLVVVITTNDVQIKSIKELAPLALDFFIMLFITYSMYVNCSDSGMRAGLQTETYRNSIEKFEIAKKHILDNNIHGKLGSFCCFYISNELKNVRTTILAIVGITFEEYMDKYVGLDELTVENMSGLSKAQKKAIVRANATQSISLTPEMIMKRGRGSGQRDPLGTTPETKKMINFGVKFVFSLLFSLALSVIVLKPFFEPTWDVIGNCCLKLVVFIANGFSGYKFGYENIIFDTAGYIDDQTDLMNQAILYAEKDIEP